MLHEMFGFSLECASALLTYEAGMTLVPFFTSKDMSAMREVDGSIRETFFGYGNLKDES